MIAADHPKDPVLGYLPCCGSSGKHGLGDGVAFSVNQSASPTSTTRL